MSSRSPSDAPGGIEWDRPLPATWALVVVLVLVHVGSGAWLWAHGASAFEAFVWSRPLGDRVAVGGRYRVLVASGELW